MRFKIFIIFFMSFPSLLWATLPHKSHSVLENGKWFRISVQKQGMYKITYDDFVAMGFDPATIDPSKISVYGNGGGMLPESNAILRPDDLIENAILVHDGGDGKLDPGDYVLFYGESPDKWTFNYNKYIFTHQKNLYSDSTFYFVTIGTNTGKRIQQVPSLTDSAYTISLRFVDHAFHEIDSVNLTQSGKTWVGETFSNFQASRNFTFNFPHIDSTVVAIVKTHVLATSTSSSSFLLSNNSNFNQHINISALDPKSDPFALDSTKSSMFTYPTSHMDLKLSFLMNEPSATGWLDYIEVNCQRHLIFTSPQMSFRDLDNLSSHNNEFRISGRNKSVVVWDITKTGNATQILPLETGDSTMFVFRASTDSLKEFIAFDGSSLYPVYLSGTVTNQDLHGLAPTDLVIVTPPLFREQADSLADFHRTHGGLSVTVVDLNQIFNEFGCGQRDPTAVRDFMKMMYDKGYPDNSPSYLLLLGDGTYDPKNRIINNNNFIPPYESNEYLSKTLSYVSDDYFGIMGDSDGNTMNGIINIGIGRLPVNSLEQAQNVFHKIVRYASLNDSTLADWKNTFTFVADDPDSNLHMQQADQLADTVKNKYPVFNVKKIYNDAYRFIASPLGLRSPDCEKAIDQAVMDGSAVFSYTGHGGEDGWSDTKILTMDDVDNWNNKYRLPVFITATCEFGRFDNPNRPTGGEFVITKPDGGGIAIFTTTRKAYASANIQLAASFFSNIKSVNGDANQKMGDLMRIVKNKNNNNIFIRNFVLLGDPAQDIAFPVQQVVTTLINGQRADSVQDTLLGMSRVTVRGEVRDVQGLKMGNYNGIIYPKVFDKPVTYSTIGNTPVSFPEPFQMQDRLLFSGKTTVSNGGFEFTFMMPKDIGLQYGKGKISYYSHDSLTDANGYNSNIIIGGENSMGDTVIKGPEIYLYMDNTEFISGNQVGSNPLMLAFLKDPVGINYYNLGIGHSIIGILDDDDSHSIELNDYFQPDTNSFISGTLKYPFADLTPGYHSLLLKVWNVYDILNEKEIYFWVNSSQVPLVQKVRNIPNPLRTNTKFVFSSMTITGDVNVEILIYSFTGQLVKTINRKVVESSGEIQVIPWDGYGENGKPLSNGIYPYRIILQGGNESAMASQKIVILR
jgi:hypothetical protein